MANTSKVVAEEKISSSVTTASQEHAPEQKKRSEASLYAQSLGMNVMIKELDQRSARPFMISRENSKKALITIIMFQQIEFKFSLSSIESAEMLDERIEKIKSGLRSIAKMYHLDDTTMESINFGTKLETGRMYKCLRLTMPYVVRSREILNDIMGFVRAASDESIEFRKYVSDILKIKVDDQNDESSNSVFAKGFAAMGYTQYNSKTSNDEGPYIAAGSFIEADVGFDNDYIRDLNKCALVTNKCNIYNAKDVETDYAPYTLVYNKRASIIIYEIDGADAEGYRVLRHICRVGVGRTEDRFKGKEAIEKMAYIINKKVDVIKIKKLEDIFMANDEFALSKLIGAPAEGIRITRFLNDLSIIDDKIFGQLSPVEEEQTAETPTEATPAPAEETKVKEPAVESTPAPVVEETPAEPAKEATEEKPKRKRTSKKSKKTEEAPVVEATPVEEKAPEEVVTSEENLSAEETKTE